MTPELTLFWPSTWSQPHNFAALPARALAVIAMMVPAPAASASSALSFLPPEAVWFPPPVPVSGEAIQDYSRVTRQNSRFSPPSGLADFVAESFYPPLSTRLHSGSLSTELSVRLEAYRARRGTLLNELADQLVALTGADAETRDTELRALAARQSPRIVALEKEVEELRRSLIAGGVLHVSVDWNRRRKWTIGVTRFAGEHAEKEAEFQVVRAAAYYQDGLTAEQRGLLLEVAVELQQRARAARPVPGPKRGDPAAMFFSPAMGRMRMPKNATPELVAMIARYNRDKTALKEELRSAVLQHDRMPREDRALVFMALADEQWPRFVDLEKLAEQIRVALTQIPPAMIAAPPHIPASLLERIHEYNRDRRRFVWEFDEALNTASRMVSAPRISSKMSEDERVQLARKLAADRAALREKVARQFQEHTRERYEAMLRRYEAIQADLKLVADGQFDPETGRPLTTETLLRSHTEAMERFDVFAREEVIYRGYRTAMLMPGLSPEQRRLLFNAAIVGLAQPLPYGEPLPTTGQPIPHS